MKDILTGATKVKVIVSNLKNQILLNIVELKKIPLNLKLSICIEVGTLHRSFHWCDTLYVMKKIHNLVMNKYISDHLLLV